jgi:hypothetical protein
MSYTKTNWNIIYLECLMSYVQLKYGGYQTRLSWSHKTLAPLGTITMDHTRAEWLCVFSKLTQLTRIDLEQALIRSN